MTLSMLAFGLLSEHLGEIGGALAQFLEQPGVFDGDHRLFGEVLKSSICLSLNGRTSGDRWSSCRSPRPLEASVR